MVLQHIIPHGAGSLFSLMTASFASKYISAIGLTILLYDHLLTFADEVRLIWPARWSPCKTLLTLNRYFLPIIIIFINFDLSQLHPAFSDTFCKGFTTIMAIGAVASLAGTNYVVLARVVLLWERKKCAFTILMTAYWVTHIAVVVLLTLTIIQILPNSEYNPLMGTCTITKFPSFIRFVWVTPLAYEVTVFFFTCWNALDRPRYISTPLLMQTLYKDGLAYFFCITMLRIANVVVGLVASMNWLFSVVYFIEAMVTVVVAHLLINLNDKSVMQPLLLPSAGPTCLPCLPLDNAFPPDRKSRGSGTSDGTGRVWATKVATFEEV